MVNLKAFVESGVPHSKIGAHFVAAHHFLKQEHHILKAARHILITASLFLVLVLECEAPLLECGVRLSSKANERCIIEPFSTKFSIWCEPLCIWVAFIHKLIGSFGFYNTAECEKKKFVAE